MFEVKENTAIWMFINNEYVVYFKMKMLNLKGMAEPLEVFSFSVC